MKTFGKTLTAIVLSALITANAWAGKFKDHKGKTLSEYNNHKQFVTQIMDYVKKPEGFEGDIGYVIIPGNNLTRDMPEDFFHHPEKYDLVIDTHPSLLTNVYKKHRDARESSERIKKEKKYGNVYMLRLDFKNKDILAVYNPNGSPVIRK